MGGGKRVRAVLDVRPDCNGSDDRDRIGFSRRRDAVADIDDVRRGAGRCEHGSCCVSSSMKTPSARGPRRSSIAPPIVRSVDGGLGHRPPSAIESVCDNTSPHHDTNGSPTAPSRRRSRGEFVAGLPVPKGSWLERVQLLGSFRGNRIWRSTDRKRFFTWDSLHGEVEVWNRRGCHLGSVDPMTGALIGDAIRGRRQDVP